MTSRQCPTPRLSGTVFAGTQQAGATQCVSKLAGQIAHGVTLASRPLLCQREVGAMVDSVLRHLPVWHCFPAVLLRTVRTGVKQARAKDTVYRCRSRLLARTPVGRGEKNSDKTFISLLTHVYHIRRRILCISTLKCVAHLHAFHSLRFDIWLVLQCTSMSGFIDSLL